MALNLDPKNKKQENKEEVDINYQSFSKNPADMADDVEERMIETLGVIDDESDVTEEEVLYGDDESDFDPEYYDNAGEWREL